jgi:hypothetical protein
MGLTLIEAAKHETRVERLAVIRTFSEGQLIRRLPFRNLTGGALKFAKEKKLPRVGFRAVSEGYRRDYGAVSNDTEYVHLFSVQRPTLEVCRSFPWATWTGARLDLQHKQVKVCTSGD